MTTTKTTTKATESNIDTELLALQAEMPVVRKGSRNPHFQSTYAGLPDIMDALQPLFTKRNLTWTVTTRVTENGGAIATGILKHIPSGTEATAELPLLGTNDMQRLGSALTYVRRQLLGIVTGVITDEDDDGNLAARNNAKAAAFKDWKTVVENANLCTSSDAVRSLWVDEGVGNAPAWVKQALTDRANALDAPKGTQTAPAAPQARQEAAQEPEHGTEEATIAAPAAQKKDWQDVLDRMYKLETVEEVQLMWKAEGVGQAEQFVQDSFTDYGNALKNEALQAREKAAAVAADTNAREAADARQQREPQPA